MMQPLPGRPLLSVTAPDENVFQSKRTIFVAVLTLSLPWYGVSAQVWLVRAGEAPLIRNDSQDRVEFLAPVDANEQCAFSFRCDGSQGSIPDSPSERALGHTHLSDTCSGLPAVDLLCGGYVMVGGCRHHAWKSERSGPLTCLNWWTACRSHKVVCRQALTPSKSLLHVPLRSPEFIW